MVLQKATFMCEDPSISPSIGVPVYVTDEGRLNAKDENGRRFKFPRKYRGGTIIEDLSFIDAVGNVYHVFKVRHANGDYVWGRDELVEVGGITLPETDWALPEEGNN